MLTRGFAEPAVEVGDLDALERLDTGMFGLALAARAADRAAGGDVQPCDPSS